MPGLGDSRRIRVSALRLDRNRGAGSSARVSKWSSDSPLPAAQDGRMFDLVLHDLDHLCRWALRDQIPGSACVAEEVYFSLPAKSLQENPEVWKGVVLASDDPTVVASNGLNLNADHVSK